VAPGFIGTEIVKAMPQKVLDGMVGRTPLGRMGEPRDIAEAYLWLASDPPGFVHGGRCRWTAAWSSAPESRPIGDRE
jgi:3-oxoacyl-[acyl-carrier protein] reductase